MSCVQKRDEQNLHPLARKRGAPILMGRICTPALTGELGAPILLGRICTPELAEELGAAILLGKSAPRRSRERKVHPSCWAESAPRRSHAGELGAAILAEIPGTHKVHLSLGSSLCGRWFASLLFFVSFMASCS